MAAAVVCAWFALCLLFWQGSWQLLYHPVSVVARTPANAGLPFEPIGFAATGAGMPRLAGWWIPAAPEARFSRLTVLYLHGQDGNLGGTVDALARLHAAGVNVLAFDYRGYGQSQFVRPSEAHWREDAEWALRYLTGTRHIAASAIVLDGAHLGANLALEVAAAHPELDGAIVESPLADPAKAIFNDARARLVPARLLVRDRYDLSAAASAVRIPVLWIAPDSRSRTGLATQWPAAYAKISGRKMLVWISPQENRDPEMMAAFTRWLDDLPAQR